MSVDEIVSVIMPCYNGAQTVEESINSVLHQSYPHYKLYVVDDGSIDDTPKILSRLAQENPGKIWWQTQANQGQTAAKNVALSMAKGTKIALLDSDDLWHPTKLEKQLQVFEKYPDVGICYTNGAYIDEQGKKKGEIGIDKEIDGHCLNRLMMGNAIVASSVVFKKELIQQVGCFDTHLSACENWELWVRMSRVCTLKALDDELIYYRRHQNNMSLNFEKLKANRLKVIEKNNLLYRDVFPQMDKLTKTARFKAYRFFGENYLWHLDMPKARKDLIKAMMIRPTDLSIYPLLLKTCLGKTLIQRLRNIRGGNLARQSA